MVPECWEAGEVRKITRNQWCWKACVPPQQCSSWNLVCNLIYCFVEVRKDFPFDCDSTKIVLDEWVVKAFKVDHARVEFIFLFWGWNPSLPRKQTTQCSTKESFVEKLSAKKKTNHPGIGKVWTCHKRMTLPFAFFIPAQLGSINRMSALDYLLDFLPISAPGVISYIPKSWLRCRTNITTSALEIPVWMLNSQL